MVVESIYLGIKIKLFLWVFNYDIFIDMIILYIDWYEIVDWSGKFFFCLKYEWYKLFIGIGERNWGKWE